ncbi:MAG TPA: uracil-DNA glycosylase [Fimbriimonadaceae bacterium]|nr:uracil-DNA glycosylase [Fimbriimonadaceae bacterium]
MGASVDLTSRIIGCRVCPRLVDWREEVARVKRKAFEAEDYWGKPVPNFGDPEATHLIVGLAPAAHGANRTGRMFTGDRSGDWLYAALNRAGVANQATSERADDGLALSGAMITAVCHCAPPDNKPTQEEILSCRPFLSETLNLKKWLGILCLGGLAWTEVNRLLGHKPPPFKHGQTSTFGEIKLVASYHPSQQNTFTGRLTEQMLDDAIQSWLIP